MFERQVEIAAVQEHRRDQAATTRRARRRELAAECVLTARDQDTVVVDPVARERPVDRRARRRRPATLIAISTIVTRVHAPRADSRCCCALGGARHLLDPLRLPRVLRAAQPDRARASCTRNRSGARTRSTRGRSRGPDGGSSSGGASTRLAYRRARRRRLHARGAGLRTRRASSSTSSGRPRRSRRRSRPATSAFSAAPRSTRRVRSGRSSATRRSSAASANAIVVDGFDVGASPREFAGPPKARTLILTTTNGTRAILTAASECDDRAARLAAQPVGRRRGRTAGERGRRGRLLRLQGRRSHSTTRTAPAGSSMRSAASRRTRRSLRRRSPRRGRIRSPG